MPEYIREAFTYSFTVGLHQPEKRLIEKQWLDLLIKLRGDICACTCGAQSFFGSYERDEENKLICFCGTHFAPPLEISDGKNRILLSEGTKIYNDDLKTTAEVVRNKVNPGLWGLKNLTDDAWSCTLPNGQEKEIQSGSAAPIFKDTAITIGGINYRIKESE